MKTFVLQHDLVVGIASGHTEGPEISEQFSEVPIDRLRFNGTRLIDIAAINQFFVDSLGIKHIGRADPSWQPLRCAWDELLILDDGQWRVIEETDRVTAARKTKIDEIARAMTVAVAAGFTCENGIRMNCDLGDIQRLKSAMDLALELGEASMSLIDYWNDIHSEIPLTEIKAMLQDLGLHYRQLYFTKQQLRRKAMDAADHEALDWVIWP